MKKRMSSEVVARRAGTMLMNEVSRTLRQRSNAPGAARTSELHRSKVDVLHKRRELENERARNAILGRPWSGLMTGGRPVMNPGNAQNHAGNQPLSEMYLRGDGEWTLPGSGSTTVRATLDQQKG